MTSTKGAQLSSAWTFDDHRALTPVLHPLHILPFVFPLVRRYTASLFRAFYLALPPRATRYRHGGDDD